MFTASIAATAIVASARIVASDVVETTLLRSPFTSGAGRTIRWREPACWLDQDVLGRICIEHSPAMGQRLGITASGVRKLEQAEAADAITLATLRRMAEALDCELHYALVPRQPLRQMRWQQAQRLAQPVDALSTSPRDRLEAMAQEILQSSGTRLWD